ncbi:MAG: site-2 protease family protein [Candidatus Woesearchaeota archaeon]
MYSLFDLQDKIKRYLRFNDQEVKSFIITALILAFCLSFRQWGPSETPDVMLGLKNLFNMFLIVSLALLVRIIAQKMYALHIGFNAEYEMWFYGLLICLLITFLSRGFWFFIAAGSFVIHFMPGHRLGYFRYGLNYFAMGVVALMGPVANILLALVLKILQPYALSGLVHSAIVVNIYFAIFNMLPIPPLDGSKIFFASRAFYFFSLGFIAGASLLLFINGILWILLSAILLGILFLIAFLWIEKPF